jgi:hypothetical protein
MDAAYVDKAKWWLYTGGRAIGPKLISQILKGAEGQTDERYSDYQSSEREVALTVDSARNYS